ncbi:MAG: SRPBCC family protein [Microscillaceae bacterium]|nr:SRPBCC family protein [Microscillaceae bacterium]
MKTIYQIQNNIAQADTLPNDFYFDPKVWETLKEKAFAQSWQFVGDAQGIFVGPENAYPFCLLDKYLDEPLLLSKQGEKIQCLSNVCTHRGFLLLNHPAKLKKIVCAYHGRRFGLDGKFEHMPEFEGVADFPRPCEHLTEIPLKKWKRFLFVSLKPAFDFEPIAAKLEERLGFLPLENFRFAPEYSKTYHVHAHWALYCDNYLEGFHIPFVHHSLNKMLDFGSYTTECYDHMCLQIGYADQGGETFDLPQNHPDYGREVTAYYYWIFPNFMLNFYPWGVQLNIVRPYSPDFCKVEFLYYIHNQNTMNRMEGEKLAEKVEREDEFVVEGVQKGLKSRFYSTGRFSPEREQGVHHFHKMLANCLK